MASGYRQAQSGSFQSDGTARTVQLGFTAIRVTLKVDTGAGGEYQDSMSATNTTFKRTAAGVGSTITGASGITMSASATASPSPGVNDQFTVGTDGDLNPGSDHVVYWWAEE